MSQLRSEQWPHEIEKAEKGTIRFKPVVATVAKLFDTAKGVGWRFAEDPTPNGEYRGVVWNAQGPWNEATKSRDPYTGPKYSEGAKVEVVLSSREGTSRSFYDVVSIKNPVVQVDPPPANGTAPTAPPIPVDPRNRSIERQVAAKGRVDVTVALLAAAQKHSEFIPLATEALNKANAALDELWLGKPPAQPTADPVWKDEEESPLEQEDLPW